METYVPTVRIRGGARQTGLGLKASVAYARRPTPDERWCGEDSTVNPAESGRGRVHNGRDIFSQMGVSFFSPLLSCLVPARPNLKNPTTCACARALRRHHDLSNRGPLHKSADGRKRKRRSGAFIRPSQTADVSMSMLRFSPPVTKCDKPRRANFSVPNREHDIIFFLAPHHFCSKI